MPALAASAFAFQVCGGCGYVVCGHAFPVIITSPPCRQGTNACAILQATSEVTTITQQSFPWSMTRMSVAPLALSLATQAITVTDTMVEFTAYVAPRLSYLCQHMVRGRPIMPGAGFVEFAMQSLAVLTDAATSRACITDITLRAPMTLPNDADRWGERAPLLTCHVDLCTGQLEIWTGHSTVHMQAQIATTHDVSQHMQQHALLNCMPDHHKPQYPIVAQVASPPDVADYIYHPAMLDCMFQSAAMFQGALASLKVPVGLKLVPLAPLTSSHAPMPVACASMYSGDAYSFVCGGAVQVDGLQVSTVTGATAAQSLETPVLLSVYETRVQHVEHNGDGEDADMLFDVGIEKHHTSMLQLIQELPSVKVMGGVHAHVQQAMLRCVHLEGGRVGWGVSSSSSVQGHALVGVLDEAEGGAGLYGQEQGCVLATQRVVQSLNGVVVDDVRVEAHPRGSLSNLVACPVLPEDTLGGDVVVGVGAVGLNFRDLLNVLVCGACACA